MKHFLSSGRLYIHDGIRQVSFADSDPKTLHALLEENEARVSRLQRHNEMIRQYLDGRTHSDPKALTP